MELDLNKMMTRISALIAKADATEAQYPEEAKSFRAKAQELLRTYQIKEDQLIAATGEIRPIRRRVVLCDYHNDFKHQMGWLWSAIARHSGVRYVNLLKRDESDDSQYVYVADTIGYDVDIRLAEILYNAARLVFSAHLQPEVEPNLSEAENVYRLRSAGIDRQTIAERVFGRKGHQEGLKVGKLYKEECERRGEPASVSGRTVNAKTYREVYAREFVTAIERRLRVSRDAADAAVGAVVSVGRAERVQEAFYTAYPEYRPQPEPEAAEATTKGRKPRKSRGLSKSELARYDRLYHGQTAQAATQSARSAAEKVHLDRSQRADRVGESEPTGELGA